MPYINYDTNGNITGQFACPQYQDQLFFDIPNDEKIYKVVNEQLVEDTFTEFQNAVQYQHDAFDEFSSVTNNQIKTLENLYAANVRANNTIEAERLQILIDGLQDDLLTEQQAVIIRINDITEAYNAST